MRRWLICLTLLTLALGCTVAPDSSTRHIAPADEPVSPAVVRHDATKRQEVLPPPETESVLSMEDLARTDPIAFVEKVIDRYDREVKTYRVTLEKRERVKGKLQPVEVVECSFREKPFSVRMDWTKGAKLAQKTAYVEGENRGNLLVLGTGLRALVGVVEREPDGADAKSSSRYPITEFGIQIGTRRLLESWKVARERGDLKVAFNGVKKLKELNDRPVWELKRTGYPKPEDDGITESTFYFDVENWLQIGSVLTGEKRELIATYYFRDLELNADIDSSTFTKAALKK
jgi:hypothetical protein